MSKILYGCPCGWHGKASERVEFNGVMCCPVCVRQRKTPQPAVRIPMCPWSCGMNGVSVIGHRRFYCHGCHREFDDSPNEGGDFSNDPVRSAERREERTNRPKKRPRHQF